jgi:hypothetical protein
MGRPTNYLGHRFQRPWILGLIILAALIWIARGGNPSKLSGFLHRDRQPDFAMADGAQQDNIVEKPAAPVLKENEIQAPGPRPLNPVEGKRLFHNVSPQLFTTLDDDAVHRFDEQKSFFTILKTLADADQRDIQLASVGVRNYRQLAEQTDEYRGEIVTVSGIARRIIAQPANENTLGIKKFYEVWIEPSGGRLPLVVDVLEIPAAFPIGSTDQYVEVTGFYYKRLGYPGVPDPKTKKETFRSAPLVLGKTLTWSSTANAPANIAQAGQEALDEVPGLRGVPVKWAMPILGVGIVVMIFLAVWSFRLSRTSVVQQNGPIVGRLRREAEAARPPTNLNQLKIDP